MGIHADQGRADRRNAGRPRGLPGIQRPRHAERHDLQGRDTGSSGAKQNSSLADTPVISGDGRYIAFTSTATNLAGGFAGFHVYLRDTQTNTTTLVSRADGIAGDPATPSSRTRRSPRTGSSSPSSRQRATSGSPIPPTNIWVYVRDTVNNTTTLVSRADGAAGDPPDADAGAAAISGDGGSVAFRSAATNLDDDAGDGTQQVFVRDLTLNETVLASRADGAAGSPGDGRLELAVAVGRRDCRRLRVRGHEPGPR